MTIEQVYEYFKDKENAACPIAKKFVMAGYQQERGGYIEYAHELGVDVDYTQAKPSQWWHLIYSYCNRSNKAKLFPRSIMCGELYIWMAEVSGCFTTDELIKCTSEAIKMANTVNRKNKKLPPLKPSRTSNKMIRDYCFDRIRKCIESDSL